MVRSLTLLLVLTACASGCVRRTLSVTSEPAGAGVVINGQPAGQTPLEVVFYHHGTYRVEVRKEGYLPITDALRLRRKFYEYPVADLFFEVLWPGVIRDRREAHYKLERVPPFDKRKVLADARRAAEEAEKAIPELVADPKKPGGETPDDPAGGEK